MAAEAADIGLRQHEFRTFRTFLFAGGDLLASEAPGVGSQYQSMWNGEDRQKEAIEPPQAHRIAFGAGD